MGCSTCLERRLGGVIYLIDRLRFPKVAHVPGPVQFDNQKQKAMIIVLPGKATRGAARPLKGPPFSKKTCLDERRKI